MGTGAEGGVGAVMSRLLIVVATPGTAIALAEARKVARTPPKPEPIPEAVPMPEVAA